MKNVKYGMDSVIKGNTGEYYVLAELSRHGWTAAQTARNARAYDVLARKGTRQVAIRVKTKTSDAHGFQWNAKADGTIFAEIGPHDFCVLVDIPAHHAEFPKFYIVPTHLIDSWLRADFDKWLNTPGTIKVQHSADNKRRLFYVDDDERTSHGYRIKLERYRANWDILEGNSGA
ncbi:MAG: hypothetical protein ACREEL_11525 [Stellaceae bacterium]